jgi:hypothetical protein
MAEKHIGALRHRRGWPSPRSTRRSPWSFTDGFADQGGTPTADMSEGLQQAVRQLDDLLAST